MERKQWPRFSRLIRASSFSQDLDELIRAQSQGKTEEFYLQYRRETRLRRRLRIAIGIPLLSIVAASAIGVSNAQRPAPYPAVENHNLLMPLPRQDTPSVSQ
jgi:hypothetical protein